MMHISSPPPPHGASRLVQAMSARSVKTRRAPSRHCIIGVCDRNAIQDKGTQGCQVWQTHFFLTRIFLLIYLSQSSSLRAEGEEDRVTWWGPVFRKADRAHNSHSGPCSHVSSSSYIYGNSYLSMNSQHVLPNMGSRTCNSHTVLIFP